jgi:16S rRNA processing protein RimM
MERAEERVLIGKVTKPHGIRGEVKVYPYSGIPENFLHYTRVLLAADATAAAKIYTIERARVQKNSVLVQLQGCTTRNEAEALVQQQVFVLEDDLPELDPDEFYLRDLEGRRMVTEDGTTIGTITGILTTGGQDIVQVKGEGREYMIPLVPEFLVALTEDEVRVSLPPGLLDING